VVLRKLGHVSAYALLARGPDDLIRAAAS